MNIYEKLDMVQRLYDADLVGQAIVFCNTRQTQALTLKNNYLYQLASRFIANESICTPEEANIANGMLAHLDNRSKSITRKQELMDNLRTRKDVGRTRTISSSKS